MNHDEHTLLPEGPRIATMLRDNLLEKWPNFSLKTSHPDPCDIAPLTDKNTQNILELFQLLINPKVDHTWLQITLQTFHLLYLNARLLLKGSSFQQTAQNFFNEV